MWLDDASEPMNRTYRVHLQGLPPCHRSAAPLPPRHCPGMMRPQRQRRHWHCPSRIAPGRGSIQSPPRTDLSSPRLPWCFNSPASCFASDASRGVQVQVVCVLGCSQVPFGQGARSLRIHLARLASPAHSTPSETGGQLRESAVLADCTTCSIPPKSSFAGTYHKPKITNLRFVFDRARALR